MPLAAGTAPRKSKRNDKLIKLKKEIIKNKEELFELMAQQDDEDEDEDEDDSV